MTGGARAVGFLAAALVDDYMNASEAQTKDHSRRVNYNILADLILGGWRKSRQAS